MSSVTVARQPSYGLPLGARGSYRSVVRATPGLVTFWAVDIALALSTAANYAMPAQHSIELWAKWSSVAGNRGIVSNWASGSGSMIWVDVSAHISFHYNGSDVGSGLTPTSGSWYHVVGTFDGSARSIYVNGSRLGGPTAGAAPTAPSTPLATHNYAGSSQPDLLALLSDVAVYSRALSAGEVIGHYQAGQNRL